MYQNPRQFSPTKYETSIPASNLARSACFRNKSTEGTPSRSSTTAGSQRVAAGADVRTRCEESGLSSEAETAVVTDLAKLGNRRAIEVIRKQETDDDVTELMKDIKAAVWSLPDCGIISTNLGDNDNNSKKEDEDVSKSLENTENLTILEQKMTERFKSIENMCYAPANQSDEDVQQSSSNTEDDEASEAQDTIGPFPCPIWSRNDAVVVNNRRLFSSITFSSRLRPHRQIAAAGRTNGLPADSHNSTSSSLFCGSSLLSSSLPTSLFSAFPSFSLSTIVTSLSISTVSGTSTSVSTSNSLSSSLPSSTSSISTSISSPLTSSVSQTPKASSSDSSSVHSINNLSSSPSESEKLITEKTNTDASDTEVKPLIDNSRHLNRAESRLAPSLPKLSPPTTSNVGISQNSSNSSLITTSNVSKSSFLGTRSIVSESSTMLECATNYRDRKKSFEVNDDFRKRSGTGSSRGGDRKWSNRKDASAQMELRCCINADVLRSNVDKHWFFEDEQVRVNGSVFSKRENYDNLLLHIPVSKFNGIHIKMEDDCPQGGDDVRLCLLKTLGAHNQRKVPCIACHKDITVYDKYPLIDGTFFLSPVLHHGPPIEVMYEGRKQYLQQICVSCLWSDWKCNNCGRDGWFNGKALILGTLYYYDIISAGKCCPPTCTVCRSPLLIPENIVMQIVNGNYSLINELVTCSSCGCKEMHCIRDTADVTIVAR